MNKNLSNLILAAIVIIIGSIFMYGCIIEPTVRSNEEYRSIEKIFKTADFNISDEYVVEFTTSFGSDFHNFKETDWYSWKTLVYVEDKPSQQSKIILWINSWTEEAYYDGVLPELI